MRGDWAEQAGVESVCLSMLLFPEFQVPSALTAFPSTVRCHSVPLGNRHLISCISSCKPDAPGQAEVTDDNSEFPIGSLISSLTCLRPTT